MRSQAWSTPRSYIGHKRSVRRGFFPRRARVFFNYDEDDPKCDRFRVCAPNRAVRLRYRFVGAPLLQLLLALFWHLPRIFLRLHSDALIRQADVAMLLLALLRTVRVPADAPAPPHRVVLPVRAVLFRLPARAQAFFPVLFSFQEFVSPAIAHL